MTATSGPPKRTAESGLYRPVASWGTVGAGTILWGIACLLPLGTPGAAWWASRFMLLSALVWVPLALGLVHHPEGRIVSLLATLVPRAQPWAALALVGAFVVAPGPLGALLVVPWLALTGLIALLGLARLLGRGLRDAPDLCVDLGMLALPTGGMWLLASRTETDLFGFGEPITLLTGVHFHYAGFLAPCVIGLSGGYLPTTAPKARRVFCLLGPATCLGPWGVAIGITAGGYAEVLAGVLFAGLLAGLALLLLLCVVPTLPDRGARVLLALAYCAAILGMVFAGSYAVGRMHGGGPSLVAMAGMHGTLQALGFIGCGLLGCARLRPMWRRWSGARPASA